MPAHGADVLRENLLVPLYPLVKKDVPAFTLAENAPVYDAAAVAFFHGNHDVQAFMVDDPRHRELGAVGGIITLADADEVEVLPRDGVLAHRMEAQAADAVAPGDAAVERSAEIRLVLIICIISS